MENTWRMRNIRCAHLAAGKIAIKEMTWWGCCRSAMQASGNVNYNFPFTLLFKFPRPGCSAQLKVH